MDEYVKTAVWCERLTSNLQPIRIVRAPKQITLSKQLLVKRYNNALLHSLSNTLNKHVHLFLQLFVKADCKSCKISRLQEIGFVPISTY